MSGDGRIPKALSGEADLSQFSERGLKLRLKLINGVLRMFREDPYYQNEDPAQVEKATKIYQAQAREVNRRIVALRRSKGNGTTERVGVGMKPARLTARKGGSNG